LLALYVICCVTSEPLIGKSLVRATLTGNIVSVSHVASRHAAEFVVHAGRLPV